MSDDPVAPLWGLCTLSLISTWYTEQKIYSNLSIIFDMTQPCGGYFLRYAAYFYRFYILYATYHPLLCLAEASCLGHPFANPSDLLLISFCFSAQRHSQMKEYESISRI
jgi:hypothetical protein